MKRFFLFLALCIVAVSGFAETTAANRRAIKVHYKGSDQTREIAVLVPARCKHPNSYFRSYVGVYIAQWNSRIREELIMLGNPPKPGREKLFAALKASKLERFEEDDEIAPADSVADEDLLAANVTKGAATIDAKEAVEADLKALRAKNR